MCSKTAVAPLDRIKILLQAHNKHYKHLGIFFFIIYIYRETVMIVKKSYLRTLQAREILVAPKTKSHLASEWFS
jgi:hypothetical protein